MMVAIIGGKASRFRPLVELYRRSGLQAGHASESLKVGLHSLGYLSDSTQQAADEFYPGYAHMFTSIGKERGWPPTTREQFDAGRGLTGALLIGDAEMIVEKILTTNTVLGGLSRLRFQMNAAMVSHTKMMHAIEILGTQVAPMVRKELLYCSRASN